MAKRRKKLNLEIMGANLSEAMEEQQRIQGLIASGDVNEDYLQVKLAHAYHHLNFFWNIRHVPTRVYAKLTQEQFDHWGAYPSDLEDSD